ncbi:GNAT family N-acetyltransferase [Chitinilyticum piscinae]|uniref:GNAT family N-acetyltransferase n=1 Tax=Chitinilyticum piscinae TaxID=2866724 RepID=A0A8J7K196_9NEIS|nr:GNAT family protein [Chitinilyticum piscinae]MBE9608347.1 GNAT family N-acetyltransferase [Chitinilyticum piscinae]
MSREILIRPFSESDWVELWPLLRDTFADGDTYAFDPASSEEAVRHAWITLPQATLVARAPDGQLLGTYYLKPNQTGLGGHVCNCGYVVSPAAQGQGVATRLCEHSQALARQHGFRAMQFNLVVATNTRAVRLWQHLGFSIVGTLPDAFRHARLGYVDAHVMYKPMV